MSDFKKTKLLILSLLLVVSMTSLQAVAMESDAIKTIEQMNARLDFLYGSHKGYQNFVDQLKVNIARKNKKAVAGVVKYPLRVDIYRKRVTIKNQQQFIQNYDVIITPIVEKAVAEQQFIGMFANSQGMMFGNGQIWLSGYCLDRTCKNLTKRTILIYAINN